MQQIQKKFNFHDITVIIVIIAFIIFVTLGWHDMHLPFDFNHNNNLSLAPNNLPYYTLRTTMRLMFGLILSVIFAILFGGLAAKYKPVARIMLPLVNFMESFPVVGFLTFTIIFFLSIYPNNTMGLECAAIFAVFTGQAWNMMLSVYQTIKVVPKDMIDASKMAGYNSWQQFWRLELPYSTPSLLWNTMISQSAAWFALIASEIIPVKTQNVALAGIGSYMGLALDAGNIHAVIYSIIALILTIFIIDQLLFRPLVRYANQFKYEDTSSINNNTSWFHFAISNAKCGIYLNYICKMIANFTIYTLPQTVWRLKINHLIPNDKTTKILAKIWYLYVITSLLYVSFILYDYLPLREAIAFPIPMLLTALRVFTAMLLSVLIFVPIGIWIGLNPKLVKYAQPIIQILAALPLNIFYPLLAIFIVSFHQSLNIWSIFLIMLGTQWYILFNVIAGASQMPTNLLDVSKSFHIRGLLWWQKFMIPAIFPYIVTGIISAAGGAWNAAIAAEVLSWGKLSISASGLGAYISNATSENHVAQSAIGCLALCTLVALCIIFVWTPLYKLAETKFNIN